VDSFWTDLPRLVRNWTEAGEIMVLLADWNVDGRGEKTRKYMADIGVRELITEFHVYEGLVHITEGPNPLMEFS
jgi:hypothetical protein